MSAAWLEVQTAKDEKRYELVLTGADVAGRIEKNGLDPAVFGLQQINFLELSKVELKSLPELVGNLLNLQQLVLHSNQLSTLPAAIGKLTKLKGIDVSRNQLLFLPDEIGNLSHLQNVNCAVNCISHLPDGFSHLTKLVTVDVSSNKFERFPMECHSELVQLSELKARGNRIRNIPAEIHALVALKTLDLEDNELAEVPGELGDCSKLKELNLKGNKLKDRRLKKLVDQCYPKQVLEYIRSHCPKSGNESNAKSKKATKSKKKAFKEDMELLGDMMQVLHVSDETPHVIITAASLNVRPHILCCILRDVDLEKGNNFKKFIALQTKLHEELCDSRKLATIATHDLSKIGEKLIFDAKPPEEIKLIPLKHHKEVTAGEYYEYLRKEADTLRKVKNRNTFSGIHKYLYLLDNQPLFPCLSNTDQVVISFPPITNSDITKISSSTKDVLVEVTSSKNLGICKKVLDQLLLGTLRASIGREVKSDEDQSGNDAAVTDDVESSSSPVNSLTVEQVKIVDEIGQLRAVYPSRTDLVWDDIRVVRSFD